MRRVCILAGALLLVTGTAQAQTEHVRLVVNGGALVAPGAFGQRFTQTRNVESAPVTTDLSLGTGGVLEAGARVRVHPRLSVGAVGFVASSTASGTLNAQVPHPFYFNLPRDVSGDLRGLTRKERGVHVELALPLRLTRRDELTLVGGPSYFSVEQALITDLTYTDTYPYDTATLDRTTSTAVKASAPGFNVGAELTRQVSRSARVAVVGRYSRGTLTLSAAEGNESEVRAGGIQLGIGLRFSF